MRLHAIVLVLSAAVARAAAADEFSPDVKGARLVSDAVDVAPSSISSPAPTGVTVAGHVLTIDGSTLRATRLADGKAAWTLRLPDGVSPSWLADDGGIVYATWWRSVHDKDGDEWKDASPGAVQRLDVAKGAWLEPLSFLASGTSPEDVLGIAVDAGGVAVMSCVGAGNDLFERNVTKYRVTYFEARTGKRKWTQAFAAAGRVEDPSAFLGGSGGPRHVSSDVKPISLIRSHVLVCAGGREDVLALSRSDGHQAWKVERLWEFQRGFVGPSVWEYYIARSKPPEDGRLIGGPFAVAFDGSDGARGEDDPEGYCVFVAVGRDVGKSGGYLVDCSVYEINQRGEVIAVTPMPRVVLGSAARVVADGVLWRCDGGALAKLAPSHQSSGHGTGGSGSDHVARIAWYRQPAPPKAPRAWLTTGTAGRPFAMDEREAWVVLAGGFVRDKATKRFEFPVTRIDLAGGAETQFVLVVPYGGEVPEPESNYSKGTFPGGDGHEWLRVTGPHGLAVTSLDLDAGGLIVDLDGADGFSASLHFDRTKLR